VLVSAGENCGGGWGLCCARGKNPTGEREKGKKELSMGPVFLGKKGGLSTGGIKRRAKWRPGGKGGGGSDIL